MNPNDFYFVRQHQRVLVWLRHYFDRASAGRAASDVARLFHRRARLVEERCPVFNFSGPARGGLVFV